MGKLALTALLLVACGSRPEESTLPPDDKRIPVCTFRSRDAEITGRQCPNNQLCFVPNDPRVLKEIPCRTWISGVREPVMVYLLDCSDCDLLN